MRAPGWFARGAPGLPAPLGGTLAVAARVYAALAGARRAAHRYGLLRTARLDCAVISVGSPMLGGTAKTPTAAWLAHALCARGYRVALATRGYAGEAVRGVHVLSDGKQIVGDATAVGDEAGLLVRHAPGVPVLVGPDRARVGRAAIARFGCEVLVLDDGAQHLRLARDFELYTLDAHFGFGNARVLPAGPLREGLGILALADALLVVDGPLHEADRALWQAGRRRDAACHPGRRRPVSLERLADGEALPLTGLAGRPIGVLAGIAQPASFVATLEGLGAQVVATRFFGDHHVYRARDLAGLSAEAETWVTTEKDANRLSPGAVSDLDLQVLGIRVEVDTATALLDAVEAAITARRPATAGG